MFLLIYQRFDDRYQASVDHQGLKLESPRNFDNGVQLGRSRQRSPQSRPQRKSNAMLATSYLRRKICAREWNETRRGMKQKLLEDKIVVVTGASRGIGKGIATPAWKVWSDGVRHRPNAFDITQCLIGYDRRRC
jgi:hypothetical protein